MGLALSLSSCFRQSEPVVTPQLFDLDEAQINLEQAATENRSQLVREEFRDKVHVLPDPRGLQSVELFVQASGSNSIIIAENKIGRASCRERVESLVGAERDNT